MRELLHVECWNSLTKRRSNPHHGAYSDGNFCNRASLQYYYYNNNYYYYKSTDHIVTLHYSYRGTLHIRFKKNDGTVIRSHLYDS